MTKRTITEHPCKSKTSIYSEGAPWSLLVLDPHPALSREQIYITVPPFSLELLAKGDLFGCSEIEGSAGTEVGVEYYFLGILYTPGPTASCTCCTAG